MTAFTAIARNRFRRGANSALGAMEQALWRSNAEPGSPPVLLLGAPRCGSTLLYQLMVACFDVSYLSNLHCSMFGCPALAERMARGRRAPASFESRLGGTEERLAPSECGPFWYRFFRRSPQYVALEDAPPEQLRRLRASVAAFQRAAGRPVVFKNLLCSLRVAPIGAALPGAIFVLLHRDLLDHAHSLLEARKLVHGSYERWWSAEPPGYEGLLELPPEEQVIQQVQRVEAAIDAHRAAVGPERFLDLRYEDLCLDPQAALGTIAAFAGARGCALRQAADPPAEFSRRAGVRIEPELYGRLQRAAAAA